MRNSMDPTENLRSTSAPRNESYQLPWTNQKVTPNTMDIGKKVRIKPILKIHGYSREVTYHRRQSLQRSFILNSKEYSLFEFHGHSKQITQTSFPVSCITSCSPTSCTGILSPERSALYANPPWLDTTRSWKLFPFRSVPLL
jgi:hypothetical protein